MEKLFKYSNWSQATHAVQGSAIIEGPFNPLWNTYGKLPLLEVPSNRELLKETLSVLQCAQEALRDLGGCEDVECTEPNCLHALPKIRNLLEKINLVKE